MIKIKTRLVSDASSTSHSSGSDTCNALDISRGARSSDCDVKGLQTSLPPPSQFSKDHGTSQSPSSRSKRLCANLTATSPTLPQVKETPSPRHTIVPPIRTSSLQPPRMLRTSSLRPHLQLETLSPGLVVESKLEPSPESKPVSSAQNDAAPLPPVNGLSVPEKRDPVEPRPTEIVAGDKREASTKEATQSSRENKLQKIVAQFAKDTVVASAHAITTPVIGSTSSSPATAESDRVSHALPASTSPFAKLRMSILPASSLVRPFSVSKHHGSMAAQKERPAGTGDFGLGFGAIRRTRAEPTSSCPVTVANGQSSQKNVGSLRLPKVAAKQAKVTSASRHGSRRGILCNLSPKIGQGSKLEV